MTVRTLDGSPVQASGAYLSRHARAAGALFLVLLVCGPFSMLYVPAKLLEPDNATATAENAAASESLISAAVVTDSIIFLTEIVMAAVLYTLFKTVHPTLSLAAALARLGQAAVQGVNVLGYLLVLLLLSGGATYLTVFEPNQLDALVLLTLEAHEYGIYAGQLFFGAHLLLLAYLVGKSGYVPRVFGWLVMVAGAGYLADSVGNFLFPSLSEALGVVVGVTSMVGELPFFVWLLLKGVKSPSVPGVASSDAA